MDSDDVNAARALIHGARTAYSTLLLLIQTCAGTAQDNVKLTRELGGSSYFDVVSFIVTTRESNGGGKGMKRGTNCAHVFITTESSKYIDE